MRRSHAAPFAAFALVLVAVLAVPSAALADKKKPKDTNTSKENVQFNYGSIQWTYTQQKHADTVHPAPKSGVNGSMRR